MEMNDNTILRIKVPAHLYEAVKAQLTIKEAKGKHNLGAGMTPVKEKKAVTTDKPKATKPAAPKKANAPQKSTGAMFDKETEKMGAGVSETKKMGLEELKKLAELLNNEITKLEEKSHDKEEKEKVEENKGVEQINEEEYDTIRDLKSALGAYPSRDQVARYLGLNPTPEDTEEQINRKESSLDYYMNLLQGRSGSRFGTRPFRGSRYRYEENA